MRAEGKPTVTINTTRWNGEQAGSLRLVAAALGAVPGIEVRIADTGPRQCISYGNAIAFIDDEDSWRSLSATDDGPMANWVRELGPAVIIKHQFRSGTQYLPGTISGGFTCFTHDVNEPGELITRPRPTDVSARMRTTGYAHPDTDQAWMADRREIIAQAEDLNRAGLDARTGKIERSLYLSELWDTNVGFNWRGFGKLTFRLIEYIRAGVVPLTDSLGPEWPLNSDVGLEDGRHCVFCDNPRRFGDEARLLLRDSRKIAQVRKNLIELWREHLSLPALGQWYWRVVKGAARPATQEDSIA